MAVLEWNWSGYTLDGTSENIGDVTNAVANNLRSLGYGGVQVAQDVNGTKGSSIVAVTFLLIGGRDYWAVVACGGDGTAQEAQEQAAAIAAMIQKIKL